MREDRVVEVDTDEYRVISEIINHLGMVVGVLSSSRRDSQWASEVTYRDMNMIVTRDDRYGGGKVLIENKAKDEYADARWCTVFSVSKHWIRNDMRYIVNTFISGEWQGYLRGLHDLCKSIHEHRISYIGKPLIDPSILEVGNAS